MESIHGSVWVSLAIAVVAIAWFLKGHPRDDARQEDIAQIERVLMRILLVAMAAALVGGLVYCMEFLFST